MLVSLKEILKIAEARKIALGSFNTPNLASLQAVIQAAEELNEPVVIMHAQIHEEMGVCKMDEIAPVMLFMADRAKVPVCVHLDHGTDLDYVKRALDLGFTSVMYDGSPLDTQLNCAYTSMTVELARKYGASVEAEIGSMGKRDKNAKGAPTVGEGIYTDPQEAKSFVENTGIDALTCAFGTVHGITLKQPKLDFNVLSEIKSLVNVPLVMHGGSGVSDEDFKKVIEIGIRKVNYYTYMAKVAGTAISEMDDRTFYHDIEIEAIKAMKADVKRAISVFVA